MDLATGWYDKQVVTLMLRFAGSMLTQSEPLVSSMEIKVFMEEYKQGNVKVCLAYKGKTT